MSRTRRNGSRLAGAAGLALAAVCAFGTAACDDTRPGQDGDQEQEEQDGGGYGQNGQDGGDEGEDG